MNLRLQKLGIMIAILLFPLSMIATHYINHTGKTIIITNATAKKRSKKSYFNQFARKKYNEQSSQNSAVVCSITLENNEEGDLDNNQDDEITIISPGMSDKRKLFPTNNSFNYVITLNEYNKKFEKFDINHAGSEEEMMPEGGRNQKKAKKQANKKEKHKEHKDGNE